MTKINLTEANLSGVSEDTALEFIEWRNMIKKPLTQRAFDRAMKTAYRCSCIGITADQAIEIAIDKGWQGVTYEYIAAELLRRRSALSPENYRKRGSKDSTRSRSLAEDLNDKSWVN